MMCRLFGCRGRILLIRFTRLQAPTEANIDMVALGVDSRVPTTGLGVMDNPGWFDSEVPR